jgi:Ribbon-helix-helix protein, copG family
MPRTTPLAKAETLTFRIEPALKRAVTRIAGEERKPVGELLRELVRERVERRRRRAFETEARRQSLEAAAAARDPNSDEAAMLRWLDANLAELAAEWK